MDVAFGIIIVIIFLLIALGPVLRRFVAPLLQNWMLGKMEDNMRLMAGMPTRKEEKKARRQADKRQKSGAASFRRAASGRRSSRGERSYRPDPDAIRYLQEFAEDVEFTEIKEFGDQSEIGVQVRKTTEKIRVEEQVEDAEYTEIK